MRKLLLQDASYQVKLSNIDVTPPPGVSKLQYIENKIIRAINDKNPRLNVSRIEYVDINNEFPEFIGGTYSAVIVDEVKIQSIPNHQVNDSRYFTDNSGNFIRQRIMAHVFTSPATKNEGRNITVTQDIFPRLLDYIEKYIDSPSYTYANHPFYYISLMNSSGGLQASILSNYVKLSQLGFEFIELFPIGVDLSRISNDVQGTINFIATLPGSRKNFAQIQSTDDYAFDMVNKSLTISSQPLLVNIATGTFGSKVKSSGGGNATFNGSSEKFYWLDVLSMFELALRNDYNIDYSQLRTWYNQNQNVNSFGNSEKFPRFGTLVRYFDKKILRG